MEVITLPQVEKFILTLDPHLKGRLLRGLMRLEEYGPDLTLPLSTKITKDLYELRVISTVQIRVIYCFFGGVAYLLNGFVKKTSKIPKKEIELARKRKNHLTKYKL